MTVGVPARYRPRIVPAALARRSRSQARSKPHAEHKIFNTPISCVQGIFCWLQAARARPPKTHGTEPSAPHERTAGHARGQAPNACRVGRGVQRCDYPRAHIRMGAYRCTDLLPWRLLRRPRRDPRRDDGNVAARSTLTAKMPCHPRRFAHATARPVGSSLGPARYGNARPWPGRHEPDRRPGSKLRQFGDQHGF